VEKIPTFSQLSAQEIGAKLHRDELVGLSRGANSREWGLALAVEAGGLVPETGRLAATADRTLAREIQAELDALRMEAAGPVNRIGSIEIVPF
jgi:hypothetical protein